MISVVLRAKNEAAWIGRCLTALKHQRVKDIDVILVDNDSTDDTLPIAEAYGVNIQYISRAEFSYGRALNIGIAAAKYDTVALISSHCVPVADTSAIDRRDLWTTFRDERVRQRRDYFFHNANSGIRKSIWDEHPFDEEIRGVEDREWGKRMIALGHEILYEPGLRVYHHHGIHQGRDEGRAKRVAEVIDYIRTSAP